jgi:hypothetical protein
MFQLILVSLQELVLVLEPVLVLVVPNLVPVESSSWISGLTYKGPR